MFNLRNMKAYKYLIIMYWLFFVYSCKWKGCYFNFFLVMLRMRTCIYVFTNICKYGIYILFCDFKVKGF